jgi:peptide/nickel transport system permease protein
MMGNFWRLYRRNRSAVAGLVVLALVIFMAATAHLFFPDDPFRLAGRSMQPPGTAGFLLGSDSLGRDVAAGIAHGAKTSLLIGLLATVVAVGLGTVMGGIAGYYGGKIDDRLRGTMAARSTTC